MLSKIKTILRSKWKRKILLKGKSTFRSVGLMENHKFSVLPSSAKFIPYKNGDYSWILSGKDWEEEDGLGLVTDHLDGLPIPPMALSAGYGSTIQDYVDSGRAHYKQLLSTLENSGFRLENNMSIYEFGCAAGRMLRCFIADERNFNIFGSDINSNSIHWCQHYLAPSAKFFVNTTQPTLPFSDESLEVVYAYSIFTHLDELEDMWLLELKRVLHPKGRLVITVHDEATIRTLVDADESNWLYKTPIRKSIVEADKNFEYSKNGFSKMMLSKDDGNTQVFHSREFLERKWGGMFKNMTFFDNSAGYQSTIVFEK